MIRNLCLGRPQGKYLQYSFALFSLSRSAYLVGRSAHHQPNARSAQTGEADKLMGRSADHDPTGWTAPYGCGLGGVFGCAKARLGPKGRSETCPSGSSFFLAACVFSDDSELVLEKTALQMPSGYLRFLLSFSLSSLAALFSHSRSAP